jgi:hypothetical protein
MYNIHICIIYIYYIYTHTLTTKTTRCFSYTNRRPAASRIRDAHGGLLIIPQQLIGAALPKGGRFAEGRHVHLTECGGPVPDVENEGVDEFMWPAETVKTFMVLEH